jgi:hypothetical protein
MRVHEATVDRLLKRHRIRRLSAAGVLKRLKAPAIPTAGARPMIDGVAQADVSGLSHKNDFALAGSLGDWRDARQASQGVVFSPSQCIRGFCQPRASQSDGRFGH